MKFVRQGGSDDESSRLDPDDKIDAAVGKPFGNLVDGCMEGFAIRQQWSDVFEEDPFLGKVRDVPDFLFESFDRYNSLSLRGKSGRGPPPRRLANRHPCDRGKGLFNGILGVIGSDHLSIEIRRLEPDNRHTQLK